jgi:hypothetical protein
MELPTYFSDFLKEIRLTTNQTSDLKKGHTLLRQRLEEDETLSTIIVSTFLQGSYRRSTAVRPKGDSRSDVDVIVVTKLSKEEYTPQEALDVFVPFMEKHYKGKYRLQGRSIGISLSYVDLDVVITAAPSESETGILQSESVITEYSLEEARDWVINKSWLSPDDRLSFKAQRMMELAKSEPEWKISPLYIPDREAMEWNPTHPLEQIRWTRDKNAACSGHYVNVVKALKWWRRVNYPDAGHPKSYPLEHFIGVCCPDRIGSVAKGVTLALETIVSDYSIKPELPDHGVPEHNVFARLSEEDYDTFYEQVCVAAEIARRALDSEDVGESAEAWKELFGSKFPDPPESKKSSNSLNENKGGFTERNLATTIGGGRFA